MRHSFSLCYLFDTRRDTRLWVPLGHPLCRQKTPLSLAEDILTFRYRAGFAKMVVSKRNTKKSMSTTFFQFLWCANRRSSCAGFVKRYGTRPSRFFPVARRYYTLYKRPMTTSIRGYLICTYVYSRAVPKLSQMVVLPPKMKTEGNLKDLSRHTCNTISFKPAKRQRYEFISPALVSAGAGAARLLSLLPVLFSEVRTRLRGLRYRHRLTTIRERAHSLVP